MDERQTLLFQFGKLQGRLAKLRQLHDDGEDDFCILDEAISQAEFEADEVSKLLSELEEPSTKEGYISNVPVEYIDRDKVMQILDRKNFSDGLNALIKSYQPKENRPPRSDV